MSLQKPKLVCATSVLNLHCCRLRNSSTLGGTVLTSDGRQNRVIGKANTVLRELYCSAVPKRDL